MSERIRLMSEEEKVLLFAFRYAVRRHDTSLAEIMPALVDALPGMPQWVVKQMLRDCENEIEVPKSYTQAAAKGRGEFAEACKRVLERRGAEVGHG